MDKIEIVPRPSEPPEGCPLRGGGAQYAFGENVSLTPSGGLRCLGKSSGACLGQHPREAMLRLDWWPGRYCGYYGGSVQFGHHAEAWIYAEENDFKEIQELVSELSAEYEKKRAGLRMEEWRKIGQDQDIRKLRRNITNKLFEALLSRMQGRHLLALCKLFKDSGHTDGRLDKQRELQRALGV